MQLRDAFILYFHVFLALSNAVFDALKVGFGSAQFLVRTLHLFEVGFCALYIFLDVRKTLLGGFKFLLQDGFARDVPLPVFDFVSLSTSTFC